MSKNIIAHQYNMKLEAILKKVPGYVNIKQDEIAIAPLAKIESALTIFYRNSDLEDLLRTFQSTYLLDNYLHMNTNELLEAAGIKFMDNLILSLVELIEITKK